MHCWQGNLNATYRAPSADESHLTLNEWTTYGVACAVSAWAAWLRMVSLCSTTGGPLLPHLPTSSPPITVLSAGCSSHPSAEDTAGDKPQPGAAGWGIDLPLHSSHRSASLSLTWRHTARLLLLLLLIVYMAPPVGQCIISTSYLQHRQFHYIKFARGGIVEWPSPALQAQRNQSHNKTLASLWK